MIQWLGRLDKNCRAGLFVYVYRAVNCNSFSPPPIQSMAYGILRIMEKNRMDDNMRLWHNWLAGTDSHNGVHFVTGCTFVKEKLWSLLMCVQVFAFIPQPIFFKQERLLYCSVFQGVPSNRFGVDSNLSLFITLGKVGAENIVFTVMTLVLS